MDALEKEITDGGAVVIALRGKEHPLAYPMHAVILYKRETGDSLFDPTAWPKIDLQQDPGRWLACLWAGMHIQQPDNSWKAPFTVDELSALVDFGNAGGISNKMVEALTRFMPKAKASDPKVQAASEEPPTSPTSESSGVAVESATDSVDEASSPVPLAS